MLGIKQVFKILSLATTALFASTTIVTCDATAAGLLTPVNSQHQPLSIKSHDVIVTIHDSLAITQIDQVFANTNNQTLEAIYSFPVPEDAALGGFTYWINGVAVEGEVVKNEIAESIYQSQKSQGKSAAVAEQDSHKTFDVKVFPVQPNDSVRIQLVYFQQQKVDSGIGRYVYPLEGGGVDDAKSSFWSRNETVDERFSFKLELRSSYPIDGMRIPNQTMAQINNISDKDWTVSIDNGGGLLDSSRAFDTQISSHEEEKVTNTAAHPFPLDKDIIVYWRQEPDLPGSVDLINYQGADSKQGTFLLTITPGDDLKPVLGQRDWAFIIDKSGSMNGKFSTLIEGVRQGLTKLPLGDRFRIITFNDHAQDVSNGYQPATQDAITHALNVLEEGGVSGGTNLYAGLKKGLLSLDSDRSSAIMLVTDGVANVGVKEKKRFLTLLDKHDVRLFSFVMGNSANRPLLEGMTARSHGFYASISNSDDIMGQIQLATDKLGYQSLRDIDIDISGVKVSDLTTIDMPSIYRGQQISLLGRYYGEGKAKLKLSGLVGDKKVSYKTVVDFSKNNDTYPELERLWAYSKIKSLEALSDYLGHDSDNEQAITDLSMAYSIVTKETSLLVVEEEVFKQHGINQVNKQRRVIEKNAAKSRGSNAKPLNHRADKQQPMYKKSRPSSSGGGGSVSVVMALLLLSMVAVRRKDI
ncbi:MAG: VIT and vWA domain-containing protein [Psychrobium sp.]